MPRARSIEQLLVIVGATPGLPFMGAGIVGAYTEGRITSGEAQKLQSFGRLSPKAQKRELARSRNVSQADIDKMRIKLETVKAGWDAKKRARDPGHDEDK